MMPKLPLHCIREALMRAIREALLNLADAN